MTGDAMFTDGAAYERLMGRWSRLAGAQFLGWLGPEAGLRWLDVGCGNGAFTQEIVARCAPAAVTGIDPSAEQIAYAREREGVGPATFKTGDAQTLPFADDSFDVAVMALVPAFLPDPAKAVAEMARVVRPGGWIATYMWDIPAGGVPLEPLYAAMRDLGLPKVPFPNPASSTQGALDGLWREAGLSAIESRVIRIPIAHADFDDFWESNAVPVGPQGLIIQRLPAEEKAALRERLRAGLPRGPGGSIAYEAFANAIRGKAPA